MTKRKTKAELDVEYGQFIEELKFAFINEALIEGKPKHFAALAGESALADELHDQAKFIPVLMRCDIEVACTGFVNEGALLIERYNKRRYRWKFRHEATQYMMANLSKHFDDLDHVLRLRWFASLMIALNSQDYETLKRRYARDFDIDPFNPTAPYSTREGQPHFLRDKIVSILAHPPVAVSKQ